MKQSPYNWVGNIIPSIQQLTRILNTAHLKNMLPLDGGDFIVVMNPMGSVESVKNHPFSTTNPRFWSWWLNPGVENSQKYLEKPPPSHGLSLFFFFCWVKIIGPPQFAMSDPEM